MKAWDEEEVLKELVAARMEEAAEQMNKKSLKGNSNKRKNKSSTSATPPRTQLPFLLILVRKVQRKRYEFLYFPAETYQKLEEAYQSTCIETEDSALSTEGDAVWVHGNASTSGTSSSSSSLSEDCGEEEEDGVKVFQPYYVGKAIFQRTKGDAFWKLQIEGSTGWKESMLQKYHALEASSRLQVQQQLDVQKKRNHTAAKATAAALGGAGMGVVATDATVAAGSFTTLQTIGAVGVMASPVGMVAAAGAIGGLGTYYLVHRRNKARKKQLQAEKEKLQQLEELAQGLMEADAVELQHLEELAQRLMEADAVEQDQPPGNRNEYQPLSDETEVAAETEQEKPKSLSNVNEYQQLSEKEEADAQSTSAPVYWVVVSAQRPTEGDQSNHHAYMQEAWADRGDADHSFEELVTSHTAAKALFDPQGVLGRVDCHEADRDGWETALTLHYLSLKEQNLLPPCEKKSAREAGKGGSIKLPRQIDRVFKRSQSEPILP